MKIKKSYFCVIHALLIALLLPLSASASTTKSWTISKGPGISSSTIYTPYVCRENTSIDYAMIRIASYSDASGNGGGNTKFTFVNSNGTQITAVWTLFDGTLNSYNMGVRYTVAVNNSTSIRMKAVAIHADAPIYASGSAEVY